MSLLGIFCILAIALALSDNRRAIKLRTVIGAFSLQAGLAALVLYIPIGKSMLGAVADSVSYLIEYANVGVGFLFGNLAKFELGFIFAVHVLPIIIFFSALMSVLYYLGVMQKVVSVFGGLLKKLLGTSHTESVSATANIFLGQTEAPLLVRPYISRMTESELFAVMSGGLASVAGAVMAGYAGMGVELKYLIAASFMAAPGGLLMAKIMKPETEVSVVEFDNAKFDDEDQPANVVDAAAGGAIAGMKLVLNIGASLLAFVALIAMINGIIGGIGNQFGVAGLSVQSMLGYVLSPLAFVLGVPWEEAVAAGGLIGQKLVLNEFVAYIDFLSIKDTLSAPTQIIIIFALCGFANLASMAVLLGGLGGMAPERRHDIARLGFKAIVAGSLSNLMSAALAGFFLSLV
jgi:CNT family concentrative nucleoside transporter